MPKSTFINLSQEKRERILDTCYLEFSKYNYREASVTRIVAEAGIAKGSIYKYFEDKKDLYQYLIDHAVQTKFSYIDHHRRRDTQSIWEELWSGIEVGSRFDFQFSRYAQFLNRALSPANDLFDIDTRTMVLEQSHQYLQQFIAKGLAQGEIRADVQPDLISRFVNLVLAKASQILAEKRSMSILEFTSQYSDQNFEEILAEVRELYELILTGISRVKNPI